MKKLIASLLAVSTVASMGITAFAAAGTVSNKEVSVAAFEEIYLKDGAAQGVGPVVDGARPDQTYYYVLPDVTGAIDIDNEQLADSDMFKVKFDKEEGAKYIKSIKLIEKDVDSINSGRDNIIEVKLVDDMTDKEFKVKFQVSFSSKSGWDDIQADATTKDIDVVFPMQTIFFGNQKFTDTDATEDAGQGQRYYKPQANEENEIVWEDENDEIAMLSFDADSSTNYYYPKCSTVWNNEDYASLFDGQDAFKREFVGNPQISSTSRAVLNLNVPYINEDDEVTVDEADIIVYQVIDGAPVDITSKGKFMTTDDDKYVFQIKTRELGTYIFAEAPAADETVVDEAPAADAGKTNPGTGC